MDSLAFVGNFLQVKLTIIIIVQSSSQEEVKRDSPGHAGYCRLALARCLVGVIVRPAAPSKRLCPIPGRHNRSPERDSSRRLRLVAAVRLS